MRDKQIELTMENNISTTASITDVYDWVVGYSKPFYAYKKAGQSVVVNDEMKALDVLTSTYKTLENDKQHAMDLIQDIIDAKKLEVLFTNSTNLSIPKNLNFSQALECLKNNKKVARHHWANHMWLCLIPGSTFNVTEGRPLAVHIPVGTAVTYHPHIDLMLDGEMCPWDLNQHDVLANDWEVR